MVEVKLYCMWIKAEVVSIGKQQVELRLPKWCNEQKMFVKREDYEHRGQGLAGMFIR